MLTVYALVDESGWLRCVRVGAVHEHDYALVERDARKGSAGSRVRGASASPSPSRVFDEAPSASAAAGATARRPSQQHQGQRRREHRHTRHRCRTRKRVGGASRSEGPTRRRASSCRRRPGRPRAHRTLRDRPPVVSILLDTCVWRGALAARAELAPAQRGLVFRLGSPERRASSCRRSLMSIRGGVCLAAATHR